MKACGIVTEYNPFHNVHAYQIEQIRKNLPVDVVISVMSGNFLQRGEPAIVDKWTRTKMALAAGVDLVVELPVSSSTQSADFFAKGAIQILGDLKIRSEEHTSELQSRFDLVCRLLLEKKKKIKNT